MKSWALVMLLLAAVLAEKALARPGSADADEDEEGLQDDEPNNEPKLPPTIKSSPLTLTPKPGDTVLLPCEAENTPVVSWLNKTRTIAVGDKRLSYKDDKRIIIHPNSTLEIKDVQPSDSGSFTCKVSQGLEVVHHVNVYEPPRLVAAEPSNSQVILERGQHITMRCNFTGFPEAKITWTRKGRDLPGNRATHVADHLHFAHVTVKHAGTYVCSGANLLGKVEHSFHVAVSDVPEIELEKDMVNTDLRQTAEMVCIVHAYPPAVVEWQFSNEKLKPTERLQMVQEDTAESVYAGRRHVLRVMDVAERDLGNYYCLATNDKGVARRSLKLAGTPAPARLDEVTQGEKGGPVLYWTVESRAPITKYELMYRRKDPVSEWTAVELPVDTSNGNIYKVKYELKDVEAAEYEAKLKSHNSFGWSDLSAKYPFTADSSRRAASSRVGEAGNGAPVDRLSYSLLIGAVLALFLRS